MLKLDIDMHREYCQPVTFTQFCSEGGSNGADMFRTMHTSGERLGITRFGSLVFASMVVVLSLLVLAPAAYADSTPQLTDASTQSTTAASVGDTINLVPGTYSLDPTGAGIQDSWYECGDGTPPGCRQIAPTTPISYVVGSGDVGNYISVLETDPAAGQTTPVISNTLQVLTPPPPAPTNTTPPSISGSITSGSKLTGDRGVWTGSGNSYSYNWSRCTKRSGNTLSNCSVRNSGSTYQLSSSDVGAYIVLSVTAANGGGSAKATSSAVGPIKAAPVTNPTPPPVAPPKATALPTVSGTPQVGATVTAAPVTMSNSPSYAYQWLRCTGQSCTAIPGAAGTTYGPVAADLGDTLLFSETGTNAGGSGQAQSAKTAVVTAPTETTLQITPTGVVAGQTATLVATVTSVIVQAPPTGTITFEQAGTAIPGCVSIPTAPAGASATVTCQVTFAGSSSTLSAVFTPAPGAQVTGSDSSAIGFLLGRAATTAAVSLPSRVTLGKRLRVTAKVAPQAGTTGVSPTGDVVFLDGKKAIKGCTSTLANGIAHCAVTYKVLGKHAISAVYLGDANFSGSSTQPHTLAVVVAKPTGFVISLMTWTFNFSPRYTRVSTLTVTGVQPGLTISVDCAGSGCPKHRYVDTVTRAACGKHDTCKNVNLAKRFAGRKLGVGATLTVRLTHAGWLGKYYSFVVRHGHKPQINTACLAVGETKPGVGCTAE